MAASSQSNNSRRQQADDLLATQQLLRATLDASMNMIQVFEAVRNEQGQITDFRWLLNNQAAETIYGDVVGKSLLELQPGVVEEGIFEAFKEVVETGQPQQYEKHYVHEQFDGWFYQSVVKLNDGVTTTTADITARKNAERQLRESKELVQTVFDVSLNPIAYHKAIRDERGTIVDFEFQVQNQEARKYAEEDRTGKRFLEAYPGINDTVVFDLYAEVVETGKALNTEVQLTLRGTQRWFHLMAVKLDDGLVATALDITERKKAQEEILRLKDEVAQQAEDKYKAIFNSIDEGFSIQEVITDEAGQVTDVIYREGNGTYEQLTGLKDLVGKKVSDVLPHLEQAWLDALTQVYKTGKPLRAENYTADLDRWFTYQYSRIGEAGSPLIAAVFNDITDRKRREQQQAFLLRFSDTLRAERTADAVANRALELLADRLQLDRCHVGVYNLVTDWCDFPYQVGNDRVAPMPKEGLPLSGFPQALQIASDETLVISDFQHTQGLTQTEKGNFKALGFGATVIATVRKGERKPLWSIAAVSATPRRWTASDIQLLEEATERTWTALERAKAEEALRKSEEKYRTLFESVDDGFVIVELIYDDTATPVDFMYRENNPAFIKHVGMDLRGKRRSELALDQKDFLLEKYGHVVATGEPVHFEYRVEWVGEQWFEATVARIGPEGSKQVGVIFRNTTERKNAEEAIRKSEEKYRTLFETIEEGFCIMELVRDEKGDVVDVIFREANKAFERHTGLTDVVGKRSTELIPNQNHNRFQDYQDLSETGETTLSEIYINDINRWLRLYRLRLGPPGSNLLAAVFEDITERKQREQQQAYLLGLNDTLRPLTDPIAVQRAAMRFLGEQLGVDRAIYAEINLDDDWFEATDQYTGPSVQPVMGRFPFAAFGPAVETLKKGESLVIDEVGTEVDEDAQKAFFSIDVQAVVAVPLIKNGTLVADLSVHQMGPRHWLPHEITLIQETAERTWAALERAKAEEALAESRRQLLQAKEQLELSISAGKIGVWYWDLTNDKLQWSKEQEELYGLQAGEFSGGIAEFRTYVHPDVIEDVATVEAVNKRNEREYAEDFPIIRKDGALRWIHSRSRKMMDAAGQLLYIVGVNMDITDRKEAEDALRESEEKFRTLSNTAPALIWHNDERGENRFINQQFVDYTGMTLEEINGAGWHTIVHPDEREAYVADYLSAAHEKRAWSAQCRIRRFDGEWRWFDNQAQPLFGAAGAYGGHVGVTIDINERKRREANLSFLAGLMSDFAPLSTVEEIMNLAGMRLVNHLGLSHCFFVEVNQEAGECTVLYHFLPNEEQKITGTYKLAVFHTEEDNRILASGQSMVVDNVEDGIRSPEQAAAYKALNICALINTPHIDQGRWVFDVGIGRPHPCVWQPDEIELMQEVSARVWIRLERAKAEEALRRSEQRYRTLIDNLPDYAIYQLNGDGIISEWLEGAQRLTGYAPGEIIGQPVSLLYPPQAQRAGDPADELREALRTGRAERESLKVRKNGQYFWANEITTAIEAESGQVQGFVKISRDISRRKQAQEALRQLEQRTRLAVEAAEMATWEWHLLTDEVYWNEHHFRLLGMEPHANPVSPQAFMRHVHAHDLARVQELLQRAIAERGVYDTEFCAVLEDGSQRWMSGYGRITEERDGQPVRMSGVMFDVTERRQAEDALRLADQRKDEFLAMLAHELRNPMSTIRSGLAILTLTLTDELARSTVAMMNRQSDHLVRMVDDLLDVSRISRGKIELKKERVDLVAIVGQAVDSVQTLYQEQGRRLQVDLPGAPIHLDGDPTRLTQIVANLLTNGARYTEEDGQVWVSLYPDTDASGRSAAILRVQDNGIGLHNDQLSAIFELFVQVDNSLARSKGGLGLGLTLVKRLVELHGGHVEAQSEGIGQGSTFLVTLPTLATAAESGAGPDPQATGPTVDNRILVIDDNADAAMMMGMLLKLKGYDAHTRTSARAGVEAAKELRPLAILLDIGMPELDGYATCQLIREQPWGQAMIVIALTGYGQEEDRQRTRAAGFNGHLVKPVDLDALTAMLTDLLGKDQHKKGPA